MTKATLDHASPKGLCTWSSGSELPGPLTADELERNELMCALCHSDTGE